MKKQLNRVLLIDDDEATNFINKLEIQKTGLVREIIVKQTAQAALDFLRSESNNTYPQPELIFLDINMPAMNGWEFMDAYHKLNENQKARIIIVMLTTSLNPEDKARANTIREINDFRNKPLTMEMFMDVVSRFFPEILS